MNLFREEVRAAQAAQWLGSVRLHWPLLFTLVTGAALDMALALVASSVWGEVNRKARLIGLLVPRATCDSQSFSAMLNASGGNLLGIGTSYFYYCAVTVGGGGAYGQ